MVTIQPQKIQRLEVSHKVIGKNGEVIGYVKGGIPYSISGNIELGTINGNEVYDFGHITPRKIGRLESITDRT